jgi:hypothetical protein
MATVDHYAIGTDSGVEKRVDVEHVESASTSSSNLGFDATATKKLLRKIDLVLLPFLALLYLYVTNEL